MFNRLLQLPPPVLALLLQAIAVLTVVGVAFIAHADGYTISVAVFVFLCGVLAAALSYLFGLARWWIPIQLLFLPALTWALSFHLSSHWFLIAFLILLAVYWSTFRTQVPLYLSSEKVWRALVDLLPAASAQKTVSLIDLGSGLGGVLAHLATARPEGKYFGVESAPLPFVWSYLRLLQRKNCQVSWGSFWNCDLSQYDVVFAYLSPVPMEQLWLKAKKEMRPGSLFISSTFNVPEQLPHKTMRIDDLHQSTLLIWHM